MLRRVLAAVLPLLLAAGTGPAATTPLGDEVRSYRASREREILAEFVALLSHPNDAADVQAIERNAQVLRSMFERRGLSTRLLLGAPGTPPYVFAELGTDARARTVLFYAHYDGQPVVAGDWRSPPFDPVMRRSGAPDAQTIDWRKGRISEDWRLFARSSSDDKASIIALTAALDALRSARREPTVNVKIVLDGEEERGSPNLPAVLRKYRDLFQADLMIFGDGPVNASGLPQIVFGARGFASVELTAFGPARPVHDGHYGNWAPNPAMMLARLLAQARDDDGRVRIAGFHEDVQPLSVEEAKVLQRQPAVEQTLRSELAIGRTELDPRLLVATSSPAMNLRGFSAGSSGHGAVNAIPAFARASIDFRLVPNQKPDRVQRVFEQFARANGWFVTNKQPTRDQLLRHPKVLRAEWHLDYPAYKTSMSSPPAGAVRKAVAQAAGLPVVDVPMLGGSIPMAVFAGALGIPVIGIPIANHDNNQHAANENLRLGNLWRGIDIYAALLTMPPWEVAKRREGRK